jgi:hypothetical protein
MGTDVDATDSGQKDVVHFYGHDTRCCMRDWRSDASPEKYRGHYFTANEDTITCPDCLQNSRQQQESGSKGELR